MTRGRFITLEGGEGAGKSTQSRLLCEALEARGITTLATREPGGTEGAEAIRDLLLHPPGEGWNPRAEALLFAAARSDHVERLICPAVAAGKWVICDRFIDSSRAYQGAAGALSDEAIMALHGVGSEGLLPDLTILLEPDEAELARRMAKRSADAADAIEGRARDYHRKVAEAFKSLADAEPRRIVRIPSTGTKEETHQRIMQALTPLMDGRA